MQLRQEPCCPGCAEFLQPCVIEFRDGWAWCQVCVAMRLHCEPWIPSVLEGESMRDCTTVVNGLRFYVPDDRPSEAITAYEWYEKTMGEKWIAESYAEVDGAYAITPSGEHLLSGLDVTELRQVEQDVKRVNGRSSRE